MASRADVSRAPDNVSKVHHGVCFPMGALTTINALIKILIKILNAGQWSLRGRSFSMGEVVPPKVVTMHPRFHDPRC